MNGSSLEDNILQINEKLDLLNAVLSKGNNEEEKKGLFAKIAATFDSEKKQKERKRRLTQKEQIYQAVPIVIDGLTIDGKKQVAKIFSTTVSTPMADKKPETTSWLKKVVAVGALLVGVIIGFIIGLIEKLKKIKDFVFKRFSGLGKFFENIFEGLKSSKLGKMITGFFENIGKWLSNAFKLDKLKEFKPVEMILEKLKKFKFGDIFNVGKLTEFFEKFGIIGRFLSTGIKLGAKLGKVFPEFFVFLESIYGIFQAFTDPKMKDTSGLQKVITGVVKGILNTFDIFSIFSDRLNFVKFEEIRDRIDAIFKPFKEGKWLTGIGQILNQIISFIVALPGKAFGMIVGFFNKELGDAIVRFYERFDMVKWIKFLFGKLGKIGTFLKELAKVILPIEPIVKLVIWCFNKLKPILKFVGEKLLGFFKFLGDVISMLWQKIKEFAKWISSLPIFSKMAKKLNELTDEVGLDEMPMPKDINQKAATALAGTETQLPGTEETQEEAYNNKYNMGSPLDNMIQSGDLPSDASIKELTAVVKELNDNFKDYTDLNGRVHTNNAKLMGENTELLKDIRDKKSGGANVMVQNTANNTSFSDRTPSNFSYRRELSERVTF